MGKLRAALCQARETLASYFPLIEDDGLQAVMLSVFFSEKKQSESDGDHIFPLKLQDFGDQLQCSETR